MHQRSHIHGESLWEEEGENAQEEDFKEGEGVQARAGQERRHGRSLLLAGSGLGWKVCGDAHGMPRWDGGQREQERL